MLLVYPSPLIGIADHVRPFPSSMRIDGEIARYAMIAAVRRAARDASPFGHRFTMRKIFLDYSCERRSTPRSGSAFARITPSDSQRDPSRTRLRDCRGAATR